MADFNQIADMLNSYYVDVYNFKYYRDILESGGNYKFKFSHNITFLLVIIGDIPREETSFIQSVIFCHLMNG